MKTVDCRNGKPVLDGLIETILENRGYLSEIDGKIGDGDHGVNMSKGFSLCRDKLAGTAYTLSEGLTTLSLTLMEGIGGSMGPLYGVLFEGMADACKGKTELGAADVDRMLQNAVEGVMDIGNAKRGDKTLLDTLIPAQEAFAAALAQGGDLVSCLAAMTAAAEAGWQATETMVAKVGRASRLGERSRGVLDAGATSCCLLLQSLGNTLTGMAREAGAQ